MQEIILNQRIRPIKLFWYIPRERFLDPPPLLSILYMTIYFSANLLLFIFLPNPWLQRSAQS